MPNSYPQSPDYGGGATGKKKTSPRKFPMSQTNYSKKVKKVGKGPKRYFGQHNAMPY